MAEPHTSSARPLISTIVLSHNKAEHTRRCFDGLLLSTYRPIEVLALDNGSTDSTPALYAAFGPRAEAAGIAFRPSRLEQNAGAVTGRNLALKEARGEYVVFLDNDVVVRTRSWLERLREALEADARVGIVGPKLVYPFPPYLIQFAGGAVTPSGWVHFLGRGEPRDAAPFNQTREVQCLISACWMMRRALYEELGPLDEGFNPLQFEDIDYCYRARHAGHKVLYFPAVEMYHFENVTSGDTPAINYTYVTVKNGMRFKKRWRFMFEKESGPSDAEFHWADIPKRDIAEVGELETTD
ncbi:MAG: glycosyltransferase family 2 protein [Planctomycetes bacterium]|nr:glycosyltransferase family 2 protein [Planctomycetota bacterium]